MEFARKQYLGDGVYVEFDRGMLCLTAERHDSTHEIFLEPEVFAALQKYHEAAAASDAILRGRDGDDDEHP